MPKYGGKQPHQFAYLLPFTKSVCMYFININTDAFTDHSSLVSFSQFIYLMLIKHIFIVFIYLVETTILFYFQITLEMSRLPSNNLNDESFDFLFKIVVIGDCGIGKTSLVQRFKSGLFTERYTNTIGVDFAMKTVVVEGKRVKVCISYYTTYKDITFLSYFIFKIFKIV